MKTEIEYVAYHRVKRVFIPITDIESENPEDIEGLRIWGSKFQINCKMTICEGSYVNQSIFNYPLPWV